MKSNKKNNSKQIGFAIILTVLIVALVAGGTYAYWTWVTNTAQKTNVVFTTTGDIPENFAPPTFVGSGTMTSTTIEPRANCNGTGCIKSPITLKYENPTSFPMTLTIKLYITAFTINNATYQPTSDNLSHLHWRLSSTASNASTSTTNVSSMTPSSSFLTSSDSSFKGLSFTTGSKIPTGLSSTTPIEIGTLSIKVPANTTSTTVQYYFYAWLDSTYTHQNVGNTNTDPMQNLSFTLQWGLLNEGKIGPGTYIQSAS